MGIIRMLLMLAAMLPICFGQEFEVASVKPSPPPDGRGMTVGCRGGPGNGDPGTITCRNMTLGMLVSMAFDINYHQIEAPEWLSGERFDIAARLPAETKKEQVPQMWQRLLEQRFKLAAHRETRIVPEYEMEVAKGGARLRPPNESQPPEDTGKPAHGTKVDSEGFPELINPGMIGMNGKITLYDRSMSMPRLARMLAAQLARPILDRTELKGEYEIRLRWVTESAGAAETDAGPSLAQALQDQLGLRLKPAHGPVEFLVVDHAERAPTGN